MSLENVTIPEETFESIAVLSALEVKGVHSVDGSVTKEKALKSNSKNISSGCKVEINEDNKTVKVYISIETEFGFTIPEVTKDINTKIAAGIQNMTGYKVSTINIIICGVYTANRD